MERSTIIISGGMGDIGRAIAVRLASLGHRVALLYHRTPREEVDRFLHGLAGDGHAAYRCDIANAEEVGKVISDASDAQGPIGGLVHTAVGALVRKKPSEITPMEFREQCEVTLFGGLNLFHEIIPHLKEKGGSLIALTTEAIEPDAGLSNMAGYVAAKAALRELLRELHLELAPKIRVNAVAPGFVPTSLHRDLPPQVFAFLADPSRRKDPQSTEDVARVVSGLFDPANTVSGMTHYVSGEKKPTPL